MSRRRRAPRSFLLPLTLAAGVAVAGCGGEDGGAPAGETVTEGPDRTTPGGGAALVEGSDVWIGDLTERGDSVTVAGLRNVTARPGYDNQPAFRSDGSVLYTMMDEAGQADIWRWDPVEERSAPLVETRPESEYSPTPLPWSDGFSVVRVEADSIQRLWSFDSGGGSPSVLIPDVAPVGYHAWIGGPEDTRAALFVLGDPPTLQIWDGERGTSEVVAEGIGRSLQAVPGTRGVSFVQRADGDGGEGPFRVMQWGAGGIRELVEAPPGAEFHAWTPEGTLLMAGGGEGEAARRIVAWRPDWGSWRTVGSVPEGGRVTRLAVSSRGDRVAVVVEADAGG